MDVEGLSLRALLKRIERVNREETPPPRLPEPGNKGRGPYYPPNTKGGSTMNCRVPGVSGYAVHRRKSRTRTVTTFPRAAVTRFDLRHYPRPTVLPPRPDLMRCHLIPLKGAGPAHGWLRLVSALTEPAGRVAYSAAGLECTALMRVGVQHVSDASQNDAHPELLVCGSLTALTAWHVC